MGFTVYPVVTVFQDRFYMSLRPQGAVHHFTGLDAKLVALATCCFGLNWLLGSVRNFLALRTADFYYPKQYPRLSRAASVCRQTGLAVLIGWGLIRWINL
jgi:hypothetical protein